jgi:hypothetical protein
MKSGEPMAGMRRRFFKKSGSDIPGVFLKGELVLRVEASRSGH